MKLSPWVTWATHPQLTWQALEMEWKLLSSLHSVESGVEPQDINVVHCVYWSLCIFINKDYYLHENHHFHWGSERTCLLIVGGDELAVFGPGIHSPNLRRYWNSASYITEPKLGVIPVLKPGAVKQPPQFWNWNGQSFQFWNRINHTSFHHYQFC